MAVDGGYPKKSDMAGATLEGKREAILDRLTEAFAADRIHMEEYESRVAIAQNAHSDSELAGALSGLDASKTESLGSPSAGWMSNRIDAHMSGSSSIACVMGERRLAGDWLSGDRVGSFTFMGSTRLDLLATALPAGRLEDRRLHIHGRIAGRRSPRPAGPHERVPLHGRCTRGSRCESADRSGQTLRRDRRLRDDGQPARDAGRVAGWPRSGGLPPPVGRPGVDVRIRSCRSASSTCPKGWAESSSSCPAR